MSQSTPAGETPPAAPRPQSGLSVLIWSVALLALPALGMTALKLLFGW
jgi:hypothetical protein